MMKRRWNFFFAVVLIMSTSLLAAGQVISVDQRSSKGKVDSERTSAIIVEIRPDGSLIYDSRAVDLLALRNLLDAEMDQRTPDRRLVNIVAKDEIKVIKVIEVLKLGRDLDVDDFGIETVNGLGVGDAVKVKIVLEEPETTPTKPGPLYLGVNVAKDGKYELNDRPVTEISLASKLRSTFKTRAMRRVFRPGSREVDKTVFVRLSPEASFGQLLKVLRLVRSSGAFPIGFDID